MLVWQNVYLSKCIIADPAVQSIRKVVIKLHHSQNKNQMTMYIRWHSGLGVRAGVNPTPSVRVLLIKFKNVSDIKGDSYL